MKKSGFKMRRRSGFTLLEVMLATTIGATLVSSLIYTGNEVRKAVEGVHDETFLQTVARDLQDNLDKTLAKSSIANMSTSTLAADADAPILVGNSSLQLGDTERIRYMADASGGLLGGGTLEYSGNGGASWRTLTEVGSRGMMEAAEFAYGKYVTNEDEDIPSPDRLMYRVDDRVRDSMLRITTTLKKHEMVPYYMQAARTPRSLDWRWVEQSKGGDPTKDSDGDGIFDDKDDAPLDPTVTIRERYPTGAGETASIAFEDLYPSQGDADYNDLVAAFYVRETYGKGDPDAASANQRPGLKEVYMRYYAQARGAGYNHELRVNLKDIVKGGGIVKVYRYRPDGVLDSEEGFHTNTKTWVSIFPDSRTQLPPSPEDGWSTNARPGTTIRPSWSTVVKVYFDQPDSNRYKTTQVPPYDPFLIVKNTNQEIHLPLYDNNADGIGESYRFTNGTVKTMVDGDGDPFALLVPTNWKWPLEEQKIDVAFPKFRAWVQAGRPLETDWFNFPLQRRYKTNSLNTPTGAAPSPHPNWKNLNEPDGSGNARYVYVFEPFLFNGGTQAFLAPTSQTGAATAITPSAAPSAATDGAGNLFPIALQEAVLNGKAIGDPLGDIYVGGASGNFGWLSWDGDGSAPRLAASLNMPGDSHTYVNPDDASDHTINIGDWIHGNTGISNSSAIRARLDKLKEFDITVPVWDTATGSGANARYHTVAFARVRITDYRLPTENRITATYLGMTDNQGDLLAVAEPSPTPAPSAAPSVAPSAAASVAPSVAPSPSPSPSVAATQLMPFAIHQTLANSANANTDLGWVYAGTGTSQFVWLGWNGSTSEGTLRTSLVRPGNADTYTNPLDSADHHLNTSDGVRAFTNIDNVDDNKNRLDAIANKTVVIPLFDYNNSGYVRVSGFARVMVTDYRLKDEDRLRVKFVGLSKSDGSAP